MVKFQFTTVYGIALLLLSHKGNKIKNIADLHREYIIKYRRKITYSTFLNALNALESQGLLKKEKTNNVVRLNKIDYNYLKTFIEINEQLIDIFD